MKRRGALVSVLVCGVALVAVAAQAAEPFGYFGGIPGRNGGSGVIRMVGWALDDGGVEAVDIFVDGAIAARARYGRPSPDVAALYPLMADSGHARFGVRVDTTHYLNGWHTVEARVTSTTGEHRWLNPQEIEFLNAVQNLVPFGRLDGPLPNTEIYGVCDDDEAERRYTVVAGWALDAGQTPAETGVKWVQLLVNGSMIFDTKTDCEYIPALGGLTNCYGLRTRHVEQAYPFLADSPNAGFRFILDVGELVSLGFTQGHHRLTIRAGDVGDQVAKIADVPVVFLCDDLIGNEGAFGRIGMPQEEVLYGGDMPVRGWALDWEGVDTVDVFVDGVYVVSTVVDEARPLVSAAHPGYPDSLTPGFSLTLDSTELSNGDHELSVMVNDLEGGTTVIGRRTFTVLNP